MKTDELKLRVKKFLDNTIDLYLPPTNFFDKMKNSTAKLWLDQNMWKLGKAVDAFGDEDGEIDEEKKQLKLTIYLIRCSRIRVRSVL